MQLSNKSFPIQKQSSEYCLIRIAVYCLSSGGDSHLQILTEAKVGK
jgi:hypothetical protein